MLKSHAFGVARNLHYDCQYPYLSIGHPPYRRVAVLLEPRS